MHLGTAPASTASARRLPVMRVPSTEWTGVSYRAPLYRFKPAQCLASHRKHFAISYQGILAAGIRENQPDLLFNDHLFMMIDRGNAPESWDDFFRARWPTLTAAECQATPKWILWLSDFEPPPIEDVFLSRAFDTMDLLAHQSRAIPMAGKARKSRGGSFRFTF